MAFANRKDVARLAGVSEATVSRVFNQVGPLREETRQRVLQAASMLDYHPNALAQSFARRKSNNVGVIVPYVQKVNIMSTYYFSELLNGIGDKLGECGYGLLLIFQSPDSSKDYAQLFHTQRVDGCILLGSRDTPGEVEALDKLHQLSLPYCLVSQTFPRHSFNSVDADHVSGSREAVLSLLGRGSSKVIFLNGPIEYSNSVDRLEGYKKALSAKNVPFLPELIFQGNYSRKSGYEAAGAIAGLLPEARCIFAANDRMAAGLMMGLAEKGFLAGKDYALVGYDDSELSKMTTPPLSTVNVPFFEMGQFAAEKVLHHISGDCQIESSCLLPVTFIERASSKLEREIEKSF